MIKIIKKPYYNPLIVFLLTLGYGLLKIDFGDTEDRVAYGWLYILIVMWIFISLYLVAYLRLFFYIAKKIKNKPVASEELLSPLIVFLIINIASLFSSPFEIMFGLYALTIYSGVAFAISLVGLAMSGYVLDNQKDVLYFREHKKRNKPLSKLIPFMIVGIPIFIWWSFDAIKEAGQKQDYQQILEKAYQAKEHEYKVKLLNQYPSGEKAVRLAYMLKDGEYEIPAGAELQKNDQDSFEIEQSTYVTLEQDYTKLATIQVNSEAGQKILKDYVNEINTSLKRMNVNGKFNVQNGTKSGSIYDQPNFSIVNLNWEQEAPNELKESLVNARKSNQIHQREFDGWVSLTVPLLMKTGLLIPEITLDYDWEVDSKSADLDWDEVNDFRRDVEIKLIDTIDYTKLIDGNYLLSGAEDHLIKVRDGKFEGFEEIPSRGVVRKSNDSDFFTSSDYTDWK